MNKSRKSFLDDLLSDEAAIGSSSKQRPSTVTTPSTTTSSRPKSVRFSETGRDPEFSSFGQQRSVTLDQLFSSTNDGNIGGNGDDEDILGSIQSFTRGSRSAPSSSYSSSSSADKGEKMFRESSILVLTFPQIAHYRYFTCDGRIERQN